MKSPTPYVIPVKSAEQQAKLTETSSGIAQSFNRRQGRARGGTPQPARQPVQESATPAPAGGTLADAIRARKAAQAPQAPPPAQGDPTDFDDYDPDRVVVMGRTASASNAPNPVPRRTPVSPPPPARQAPVRESVAPPTPAKRPTGPATGAGLAAALGLKRR